MQIVPLMAMSFAAFVYVTYEMFAIGLISPMAVDLGVTEGQIGLLMTVYAGLVAVVTIPLMHYTRRMNRRPLFIATLVFLLTGIVLQAIATSYPMLVVGRVTAAFTHGLFWSLVNPMAARLAPAGQMGKAVAAVSFGSTMSTVLGAPLTTAVGHAIGWRNATWLLGVGAIVAFLLLLKTLPSMPAKPPVKTTNVQKTKSALPSLVFYLTFSVTALFATFTYLALLLQDTAGERWVAPGLALYGVVGIIFVLVAGRRVDARMIRLNGFDALFLMTSASTGLLALQQQSGVLMFVAVALLGMSSGTLPTAATTIFMHAGKGNQDMASSIYVVTFQVGIAAGSALGAATVDAGYLSGTLLITLVLGAAALVTLVGFSRPRLR
ncbi:arabinose ABC transporter permease [Corynebacterium riegelii]|uniref:Arabinose ABC transporter permease n=2 Tax=Corynebacterium riegelii TaxID=156976 RepID=A0A0K1RDJ1_9CORY|nr:arabinose ABC transporter permease [Corynebacterium riegelii]